MRHSVSDGTGQPWASRQGTKKEESQCHFSVDKKYGNEDWWRKAVRENVRKCYERMESLNRGEWRFIAIRALAEIGLPNGFPNGYLTQIITSGGCWGIESDSDESYLEEVGTNELANLRGQLHALGFSKRAIAAAVKSVLTVEKRRKAR